MIAAHKRVVVDLGTGSGQAVLRRARQHPKDLAIGIDADAAAMADASRRAAASAKRGGMPNALFLAAAAETLPGPLAGRVDVLLVVLPWGSLLHGLLVADPALVDRLTACLRPRGELVVLISSIDRDSNEGVVLMSVADAERLARSYESAGLEVVDVHPASASDVAELSSAWAKRLGIPARRPAWVFRLRPASPASPAGAPRRRRTGRAGEPAVPVSVSGG